jgi:hypothetical protein
MISSDLGVMYLRAEYYPAFKQQVHSSLICLGDLLQSSNCSMI